MDVVYRLGSATASQIREQLPEPPHAAAVRTMVRILESKGELRHSKDGPRHVYAPVDAARISARGSPWRPWLNCS